MTRRTSFKPALIHVAAVLILVRAAVLSAQPEAPRNWTPQQQWFHDARFGTFIHWGVYSTLEDGEWVMNNRGMTVAEYEKLPPQFNPTQFDAAEWVALAKAAGAKYITITSKHHDGFAMFGTKQSNWNIVDRTPWGRDPLKMLADECHRQGIKLFFYYSQLDWHNPDYYPLGRTGHTAGRPPGGNWSKYLDYMAAQLIQYLVRAAGRDANFLLNVGPLPNGKVQPEFVERLKGVGAWLAKNGESIYGTRGGPFAPRSWGVTTRRGNRIYVHILDWQDKALVLPKLAEPIMSARLLASGDAVKVIEADYGTVLQLPESAGDPVDNIVLIETQHAH